MVKIVHGLDGSFLTVANGPYGRFFTVVNGPYGRFCTVIEVVNDAHGRYGRFLMVINGFYGRFSQSFFFLCQAGIKWIRSSGENNSFTSEGQGRAGSFFMRLMEE